MSARFTPGEPAPWFTVPATTGKPFHFDTAAGRYLVLSFLGSCALPASRVVLHDIHRILRAYFDDSTFSFFGVSTDPEDESAPRVKAIIPGIRYFWDFDGAVSTLYTARAADGSHHGFTLVLDPMLRVVSHIAHDDAHLSILHTTLDAIKAGDITSINHAPVLILPRVFEPEFCRELIALYQKHGGIDSGYVRQMDGKTVAIINHDFKQRADFLFDTPPEFQPLRDYICNIIRKKIVPQVQKAFQFQLTHIERYVVSCYEENKGHFRPHRDNTTAGTAHRRFACTLNLNAEEYDGGDLRFPEFGRTTYRAPTGGACIFSCGLLHEATPVTRGTRYAFLPFFYNSSDAEIRKANMQFIV